MAKTLDWFDDKDGGIGTGNPFALKRHGWVNIGLNSYRKINFTSTLGATQGLYDSLMFGLSSAEYQSLKVGEDFHVAPNTQNPFYQNTKAQKGELERIISTTLTDIGNEVGQWQLLQHDVRKAEEMLNYYNLGDEASLKTIFVDQVDYYTGGGGGQGEGRLSMAFMRKSNIMPTIVEDFLNMNGLDDIKDEKHLGKLPQVEKNFLRAKWQAYTQWKNLFRKGVEDRYKTVKSLCDSKDKFIAERRDWLKPHVMQHKLLNNALSSEGGRAGQANNFLDRPGEVRSFSNQSVWLWKSIHPRHNLNRNPDEIYKNPRYGLDKEVKAYDHYIQETYIYNSNPGLLGQYDWLTEEFIEEKVKEITHLPTHKEKFAEPPLDESEWYYTVWTIDYEKVVLNFTVNGQPTPMEDGTWIIHGYVVTKNMLLLKLLERKCEDKKTEIEMNNIINMSKDKYKIFYHRIKEDGSYIIKNENLIYDKKNDILKGKDFEKNADDDGKIDIDGRMYAEEDFILFTKDDLEKLEDNKRITFDKSDNLIMPGTKSSDREAAISVIKNIVHKKLLTFNNYSDIILQRKSKPQKKEKPFITKTKAFFKNFGVDFRWRMEPGPYQNQTFDALTQGTFKLAGSTFWGPDIIGPLYSKMKIPW